VRKTAQHTEIGADRIIEFNLAGLTLRTYLSKGWKIEGKEAST
jgi:hypothetical protein